jgi:hypothetical protein
MSLYIYGIFLFLSVFVAGNMVTLQIQHYGIYPYVGKENFRNYIQANNNAAKFPSIIPAMLLLLMNLVLIFVKPDFIPFATVIFFLILNLIALISTFRWQRKLQGEMAVTGYDEQKIARLISTNWLRTLVFLIQAIMAVVITVRALP